MTTSGETGEFSDAAHGKAVPPAYSDRRRRLHQRIVGVIAAIMLGLAAAIGFFSWRIWVAWGRYKAAVEIADRLDFHSLVQYDPLLGWRHCPGASADSVFPEGKLHFEISPDGFRGSRGYAHEKPQGAARVAVMGDSFTFGYTNSEETWPALLEGRLGRAEVINAGTCGYGIDQMYLYFKEISERFQLDMVILAVIDDDFQRVFPYKSGAGFGKPRFEKKNGQLVLTNIPTSKPVPVGERNIQPADYRMFLRYLATGRNSPMRPGEEFRKFAVEHNVFFLLVYLPYPLELLTDDGSLGRMVGAFTQRTGIPYLDLTPSFLKEGPGALNTFFRGDGHPTPRGNAFIAEHVYRFIAASPESRGIFRENIQLRVPDLEVPRAATTEFPRLTAERSQASLH